MFIVTEKEKKCFSNEEYWEIPPWEPIYLLPVIRGYITAHNACVPEAMPYYSSKK